MRKTYVMLARQSCWPRMAFYNREYLNLCTPRKMIKTLLRNPAGLLHSLQATNCRWEQVLMGFIMGLPTTAKGNDAMVTLVDFVSITAYSTCTRTTTTAEDTLELLADRLVRHHRLPRVIVSGRDFRQKVRAGSARELKTSKQCQVHEALERMDKQSISIGLWNKFYVLTSDLMNLSGNFCCLL